MSTAKIPVVILVRVSTNKQETTRQISELQAYADGKGFEVVEICRETISGRADEADRHGLNRAAELARVGKVKKVLVHEVSRIARKNSVAHRFVESLEECGVSLYWHAQGIETLLPSGKRNPAAGIMLALLAEMARSEVETLRERINSGLAEARRKGVRLGRPEGTTLTPDALLQKHKDIVRLLKSGQSVRNAAKISGKGNSTVQRVKLMLAARPSMLRFRHWRMPHGDCAFSAGSRRIRGSTSLRNGFPSGCKFGVLNFIPATTAKLRGLNSAL